MFITYDGSRNLILVVCDYHSYSVGSAVVAVGDCYICGFDFVYLTDADESTLLITT